jgi:thiol:disulfide interchange protein DsbD
VFALSFFGLFEITLPDSWSTALDSNARNTGGFLSILLMAFTLVIVSFSCTGPIIGTLLVEAAGKSLLAPTLGMLGFAIALALPFSIFAMFPEWMKQAPKSGDWMTSFKVTLAFLELALSLKFLSVADMAYGWGILPRWLFIAIWIGCFAGIGIYLIRKSWVGKTIAVLSFAFAAYLVPGLWGAPVKAIAAFAPPMEIEGREVFNDYEEGLAYARQEGKPVIIDFTGYGCVNCRKMEAYVLDDDSVKARLKNYVFIELFVDDKRDGIGDKNSKIQRELYGANAQPFYVQLDAYGHQVADPMAFTTDPMEFINWLIY